MKVILVRSFAVLICYALLLLGPVHAEPDNRLGALMQWLQGGYSNQTQVDAGVLDAESNLLFPVFKKVDIAAFGEHVIYLQWPIGSPEGRLQRQRIWSFSADETTGAISMDFFTLKQPDRWLDAHLDPAKVKGMTHDDVIGYPETCVLPVSFDDGRFVARIPASCRIVSQSTKTAMTLQSETIITPDRLYYQEAGLRDDGSLVFQVPPQGRYVFVKVRN